MTYVDKSMAEGGDARRQARHTVLIGVKLRRPGETWFTSRITDLSESGFRLQSFINLSPGMPIWIMFSGFEGRRATVTWARAHEAGCTFETPLHSAIYDHIMRMSS
jgi:PilZ domain